MRPSRAGGVGSEREELGIFGGTFNPIHLGHLRAAEEVAEQLDLARILFVPSADPPHKRASEQCIAPAPQRLAWVEQATRDNARFAVEGLELERPGPSYSVETLETLATRFLGEAGEGAARHPVFVIGDEAFAELDSWREPERLMRLTNFAVVARPGRSARRGLAETLPKALAAQLELSADGAIARHRDADTWVRWLSIAALDISATDIRARLRQGRSVRYLLPESVYPSILASGAYAAPEAN